MPRARKIRVDAENTAPKVSKKKQKETPAKKQKYEPEWTLGHGRTVINIILGVQKSEANNAKSIVELTKLYKTVSELHIGCRFDSTECFSLFRWATRNSSSSSRR
jgi:hypothetical protein